MCRSSGFTLLEVLIALLIVTVGLVGLAGALGPISRLAGEGRERGRIALVLESRVDRLRAELQSRAPACVPPPPGSARQPDGVVESWSATFRGGVIDVVVDARLPGRRSAPDTLVTRLPCP